MTTDNPRWGSLRRPDTEFVVRLATRMTDLLRNRRAMTWSSVLAAAVVAVAASAAGYLHYAEMAASERLAAMHAETANAALQDELGKMRDELGAVNGRIAALSAEQQKLEAEHKTAAAPEVIAPPPRAANTAQLSQALDLAQKDLHLTKAQRAALLARLSKVETDTQAATDQSQMRVQQLEAERDALKAKLAKLEQQKNSMREEAPAAAQATQPAAAAQAEPAAKAEAAAVPKGAATAVGQVERVLASAGVDVARLFSQFGVSRGEGGPFIPIPKGKPVPEPTLTPEKLAAIRAMMKALPVSVPLSVNFEIGSPFGAREDPINGRESFHTGIDLDAPYDSKVYATAPGVVTYAGWRGDYGKIVEIDHGHGIATRYAHLHQFTVSVGEHVTAHQQIGYLGSTGRATGPHVHYEVLVNGEPQNPAKFFQLGHILPAAAAR